MERDQQMPNTMDEHSGPPPRSSPGEVSELQRDLPERKQVSYRGPRVRMAPMLEAIRCLATL